MNHDIPERKSSRAASLLVLATTLLAGLLLAEGLTRWFLPQEATPLGGHDPVGLRIHDPEFGVVHKPAFAGPWVRGVLVETNAIGLRDRDYGPRHDREIRILSLGDSYAFGYGVQLSDFYPKILEKGLSGEFPDLEVSVINGAVSGYNTHQQILMFDKLLSLQQPDFVLATFVADNDVYENLIFQEALIQR